MPHGKATWLLLGLAATLALAGCSEKKQVLARKSQMGTGTSSEPDKVLYQRAQEDIQRNRFDEGRLALQTLINTYPDSEYLAKAKLAVADSYFKQGGATGMTQAIAEYQDFITFFPFLDEAAYAQMQVGMAHYNRMEKPDRDRDEAIEAEGALQTFLQKYPSSPLVPKVQQRLREVQEVLAEGDFRIGYFYYVRHADRASATRLFELVTRYPLYSQADRANWMLATMSEHAEHNEIASKFYTRIVQDYPLSPLAPQAKAKLVKFGVPVPQADPVALARMQQEQQIPRPRTGFKGEIFGLPKEMLKSAPDVSMAAHSGAPTMAPRNNGSGDILSPGTLSLGSVGTSAGTGATSGSTTGAVVERVTPGAPDSVIPAASSAPASSTPAADPAPAPAAAASTSDSSSTAGATADTPAPAAGTTPAPAGAASTTTESSSKKKKGLKKLVPWAKPS